MIKKEQTYVGQLYYFKKMKNLESSLSIFLSLIPKEVQDQKCMLSRKHQKKSHVSWILLKTIFLIWMNFTRKVQVGIPINCWTYTAISGKSNTSHHCSLAYSYISLISAKWEPCFTGYIKKSRSSLSRRTPLLEVNLFTSKSLLLYQKWYWNKFIYWKWVF